MEFVLHRLLRMDCVYVGQYVRDTRVEEESVIMYRSQMFLFYGRQMESFDDGKIF